MDKLLIPSRHNTSLFTNDNEVTSISFNNNIIEQAKYLRDEHIRLLEKFESKYNIVHKYIAKARIGEPILMFSNNGSIHCKIHESVYTLNGTFSINTYVSTDDKTTIKFPFDIKKNYLTKTSSLKTQSEIMNSLNHSTIKVHFSDKHYYNGWFMETWFNDVEVVNLQVNTTFNNYRQHLEDLADF